MWTEDINAIVATLVHDFEWDDIHVADHDKGTLTWASARYLRVCTRLAADGHDPSEETGLLAWQITVSTIPAAKVLPREAVHAIGQEAMAFLAEMADARRPPPVAPQGA
jgi:hypothetical protein